MAYTANELANILQHADPNDIPALVHEIEHLYLELDGISGICGQAGPNIASDNIGEVRAAASELAHIRLIAEQARGRVPAQGN